LIKADSFKSLCFIVSWDDEALSYSSKVFHRSTGTDFKPVTASCGDTVQEALLNVIEAFEVRING